MLNKREVQVCCLIEGQNTVAKIEFLQNPQTFVYAFFSTRLPVIQHKEGSKDTEQMVFTRAERRGEDLFSKCNYSNEEPGGHLN